jgi:HEAT repeat protein
MDAARALGSFRDEEIEIELGRILTDSESPAEMRLAAVAGLGADNQPLAREIMIKALRDKNQSRKVHESICKALTGGFNDKSRGELASYVQIFEKTAIEYLPQMMQQLLARGGDEAVDLLASAYMGMKPLKKTHAIRTLGRVGSEHAFDTLMTMTQRESDSSVRRELFSVMRRFKGERYEESTVKLLRVVAQTSKDRQSRIMALKYLGEISPEEASSLASEMLFSADDMDIVLVSIDVLRRYGNAENSRVLAQLASTSEKDEVVKRAEVAMNAIDAREAK